MEGWVTIWRIRGRAMWVAIWYLNMNYLPRFPFWRTLLSVVPMFCLLQMFRSLLTFFFFLQTIISGMGELHLDIYTEVWYLNQLKRLSNQWYSV